MRVIELINRAWVQSGIVPRSLSSVTGEQTRDGLFLLNQFLDDVAQTGRFIPYYSYVEVTAVIGQEKYFIEKAVIIETVTFNIGTVRYSMYRDNRGHYFGSPRVDDINALPFNFYIERVNGGSELSVYFLPQQSLILKLKGRFGFTNLTTADFATELSDTYDGWYQNYLLYELARKMCSWYKISVSPETMKEIEGYREKLADANAMDLTTNKICTASKSTTISYAQVNLGKGWVPNN